MNYERKAIPVLIMAAFILGMIVQGGIYAAQVRNLSVIISEPITAHVDFSSDERLEALK